jgi:hypothetical protein
MNNTTTILTAVLVVAFLVIIGPILTIWALNTLFPVLAIPTTIETWLAVVIIGFSLKSNVTVKK